MRSFLFSWRSYFFLLAGVFFSLWVSLQVASPLLLPVLMTLVLYPLFVADLVMGERSLALSHALWWAAVSSVLVILFTRVDAGAMGRVVLRGVSYRDEMFRWILTGEGAEGNLRLFLPLHLQHFLAFSVVSLVTGGLLGLAMGSVLLNYMNFYVGSLSLKADPSFWAYLFGWPVWSLVRVAGFVLCGIALAQPLLSLLFRFKPDRRSIVRWLGIGVLLVILDLFLKWGLASFWRDLLRRGIRL